jgi:hypothetical protein
MQQLPFKCVWLTSCQEDINQLELCVRLFWGCLEVSSVVSWWSVCKFKWGSMNSYVLV